MITIKLLIPLYLALMCSVVSADPAHFVSIFDGKTFSGWEGNLKVFRIENGVIVGGSLLCPLAKNEFLCTRKVYGDFELHLKIKLRGRGANGGIQFCSHRIPENNEVIGYQADLAEKCWGCLYDESRRNRVLAGPPEADRKILIREEDWNDYVVRCEGRRIQLWLNGQQTVNYTESDLSVPRIGIIALQIHGGPASEAWYKDIRIRELVSDEAKKSINKRKNESYLRINCRHY